MESVYEFADKVAFIDQGSISWYGKVGQINLNKNLEEICLMKSFLSYIIKQLVTKAYAANVPIHINQKQLILKKSNQANFDEILNIPENLNMK